MRKPLIELSDVSIVRGSKRVLDRLSLTIYEGEHVAILGPNGCGKSTLIRALTRESYPYGGIGSVKVAGQDRWVISELRTLLGVVSEDPRVELLGDPTGLDLAVSGLIGTYGVTVQHEITPKMWEEARLALERVSAPHLGDQTLATMSTGERRRTWIARALVSRPKGLILDEPTNGLDLKSAHEFHQTIEDLAGTGVTLILVTHHLDELVSLIGRVILMKEGAIVEDGPPDRVLQLRHLQSLFSIDDPGLLSTIEQKLAARAKPACGQPA
jgi:iron complex transport system ATP-binding protein